jgi:hypothetical protein
VYRQVGVCTAVLLHTTCTAVHNLYCCVRSELSST